MAHKNVILILRLEGLLQSWGEHSKWDWRDTALFPSKSGIIGIIGCAMGIDRDSPLFAQMSDQISIAVRRDRAGTVVTDFQTVQARQIINAMGKPRGEGNTLITYRSYLQDACFTVAVNGEERVLKNIASALNKPKWQVYLGRKSCIPSRPVYETLTEEYESAEDAIKKYPLCERSDTEPRIEIEDVKDYQYTRTDCLLQGGRNFSKRYVRTSILK